jgi:hypothetical protein
MSYYSTAAQQRQSQVVEDEEEFKPTWGGVPAGATSQTQYNQPATGPVIGTPVKTASVNDQTNKWVPPAPANQTQTASSGSTTPATPQSTTGTPSSATGSGLPSYGSNWNFSWQTGNNSESRTGPGPDTRYHAPASLAAMGVNFSALPNYNPGDTANPQWQAPGGNSNAAHDALNGLLTGDASGMDTSAMKNKLKEQRLMMEKDQMGASRQAAAGRGMLDSGWQEGSENRIRSASRKDILGGFRDVDIAAAEAGTRNKLAASEALNNLLTGDTTRADVGFDNTLEGSKFADDKNRYDAKLAFDTEKAVLDGALGVEDLKKDAAGTNLNSWQAGTNADQKLRDQDIEVAQGKTNELIARMGLAVNLEEIAKGSSRDKMQFLTDIFKTLTQQEQFNATMGLNYNQLGMNMNEMMANIAKSIGVG